MHSYLSCYIILSATSSYSDIGSQQDWDLTYHRANIRPLHEHLSLSNQSQQTNPNYLGKNLRYMG